LIIKAQALSQLDGVSGEEWNLRRTEAFEACFGDESLFFRRWIKPNGIQALEKLHTQEWL
jgi:hypothetical protein